MSGNIGNTNFSHQVKLLGMNLKFKDPCFQSVGKQKIKCIGLPVCYILLFNKRKTLMQAYIMSHFCHCSLVWMFHSKQMNMKINNQELYKYCVITCMYFSTTSFIIDIEMYKVTDKTSNLLSDIFA